MVNSNYRVYNMTDFALLKGSVISDHILENIERGNLVSVEIDIEKINSTIIQHEFAKFEAEKVFWLPHQFSTEKSKCYATGAIIGATTDSKLIAWFIEKAIIEIKSADIHDVDFNAIDRYYMHRGVIAQTLNYTIPNEISIIDFYTLPIVQKDDISISHLFGRKLFILAMLDDDKTESSFKIFKITTNSTALTHKYSFK